MLADFAVVPIGVTGGVKELVAEALKSYHRSDAGLEHGRRDCHTPSRIEDLGGNPTVWSLHDGLEDLSCRLGSLDNIGDIFVFGLTDSLGHNVPAEKCYYDQETRDSIHTALLKIRSLSKFEPICAIKTRCPWKNFSQGKIDAVHRLVD
jgi:hypothetical protein